MWPETGINDKFLVSFNGTLFGQKCVTTFWYQNRGGTGATPAIPVLSDAWASAMQEAGGMIEEYLAMCPEEYVLDNVTIQCVEHQVEAARLAKLTYAINDPGTSQTATQTVTQIAITRRAALAGDDKKGTIRIPAPAHVLTAEAGYWLPTFRDLAEDFKGHLINSVTVATGENTTIMTPILNHGFGALNRDFIVAAEVHPEVRTQRTRVVGRGE